MDLLVIVNLINTRLKRMDERLQADQQECNIKKIYSFYDDSLMLLKSV